MDKTYNIYGQYKIHKSGCNTEVVQSLHPLISNRPFYLLPIYSFTLLPFYPLPHRYPFVAPNCQGIDR